MSNDNKTMAVAHPGGRVRLATVLYDRAHDLLGDAYNAGTHGIGYSQQAVELHDAIIPTQPSPAGQDALAALQQDYDRLLDSFNRQVEVAEKIAGRVLQQDDRIEELEEALAARQPVEEPAYNSAGISLTACQLHEALLMAGDPELDVPFEDRSLVRIFWTETGHSGPGLYCECVDAEEEGCILLDGTAPAIGQSAQAVGSGQFRAQVADLLRSEFDLEIADPEDHRHDDGSGEADRIAGKIIALLDSQAVGNG